MQTTASAAAKRHLGRIKTQIDYFIWHCYQQQLPVFFFFAFMAFHSFPILVGK